MQRVINRPARLILGAPDGQLPVLQELRSTELGKHKILLTTIMRMAARVIPAEYERALAIPYQLLSQAEARAPKVVTRLLSGPQFGAWADDCVRRLLDRADGRSSTDGTPLETDLGQLALFAATAAIQAGCPFDLDVPLRAGAACFPGLGVARPGASAPWEWGRAWADADRVHLIRASGGVTRIAPSLRHVVVRAHGLWLRVVIDDQDPFLDRYGTARATLTDEDARAWRQVLAPAWAILAGGHYPLATLIAATVRVLVPLAPPDSTRSAGSTEISSFGAVAASRPADPLTMAEILVHETHHALLGALMDTEPLVQAPADDLVYAPWRDDPRPIGALLHGIFAHYGMASFWRGQYRTGPVAQRPRAAAEYGRLRGMIDRATRTLAGSDVLTEAGRGFLAGIEEVVAAWLAEPLPATAREHAGDLATDHEARWRLSHLVPDPEAIRGLADAWRRGAPPPIPARAVGVRVHPGPLPAASANPRSYLLTLRYAEPGQVNAWIADGRLRADPADAALGLGDPAGAASGYLRRIASGVPAADAWAGLAVARRHCGPVATARLLADRPEVLAALHARLGTALHPDELARWLASEEP